MADALKNFAYSTVATAPSPATSGTSLTVATGDGTKFAVGNAVCWPPNVQPSVANAEIVRVTAISTDTLTITRAQESTTALSIAVGWQIDQGVTAGLLAQYLALSGGTMSGAIAMGANKITGLANGTAATDAAAFGQIPSLALHTATATAVSLPATTWTAVLTTPSLPIGTYLVQLLIDGHPATTTTAVEQFNTAISGGTATYSTLYPGINNSFPNGLTNTQYVTNSYADIWTVTAAGTVTVLQNPGVAATAQNVRFMALKIA